MNNQIKTTITDALKEYVVVVTVTDIRVICMRLRIACWLIRLGCKVGGVGYRCEKDL